MDFSEEPPLVYPDAGRRRFEFDLADGSAESFLVDVVGWVDPEEDLMVPDEYTFGFEIDWFSAGRQGSVHVPGAESPLLWHPLCPQLGTRHDLRFR